MGTRSSRVPETASQRGIRVAFDENVPAVLAKVFIALAKESPIRGASKGIIWERAADYAPGRKKGERRDDVPWLDKFAAAGGHAVISGDVNMRRRNHEKLALYHHGFVVVFFEAQWSNWNFFHRTGLMLHWWGDIISKIRTAAPGTFWVVPCSYPREAPELRNMSLGLARLLKDAPKPKTEKRKRGGTPRRRPSDERQHGFIDKLDGGRRDKNN